MAETARMANAAGKTGTPGEPRLVIAIDGPAAAGKGTLARRIAAHYDLQYLDTGALYRAVGLAMLRAGLDTDDEQAAAEVARKLDVSLLQDPELRSIEAGDAASKVARHKAVRAALLDFQRDFARQAPRGAVLDGRDIGTVVLPGADVKLFITASPEVRARRRWLELGGERADTPYEEVLRVVKERDARDASRAEAPMKPAEDAHLLDTSELDIDAAFQAALRIIDARIDARRNSDA